MSLASTLAGLTRVLCDGAFAIASGEAQIGWILMSGILVAPTSIVDLRAIKIARINLLTLECAAAIVGGYESSALGSPHSYPNALIDQINMMGSVTASLLSGLAADWQIPFWCEDEAGGWAYRMHSAVQIQSAGSDGKAHVVTCQATLQQRSADVWQSATAEMVEAVTWSLS